jgi:hypothetical protein
MKDDINIRELYNQILEERAFSNGIVIKENVKIPSKNNSPDKTLFDGVLLEFDNYRARPFAFIGDGSDLIGYGDEGGTHPYIFNAFIKLAAALEVIPFPAIMSHMKTDYIGTKIKDAKRILKSYDVRHWGSLDLNKLKYFGEKQRDGILSNFRKNTRSGRIWFNVKSKTTKGNTTVVAFWCRQKDVRPEDLENIKNCFKVSEIFWVATDSSKFNYYNDDFRENETGKVKELKSKVYPDLTHDQIVDILMRAHTGYKITPFEQKVVWEFRGFDPSDLKQVTGGYPTRAEYEYRSRYSEQKESKI